MHTNYYDTVIHHLSSVSSNAYLSPSIIIHSFISYRCSSVGIKGNADELGITNTNTWHIPVNPSMDAFEPIDAFFSRPLDVGPIGVPAFITFPSLKDKAWSSKHPHKVSCQILIMAHYDWFKKTPPASSSSSSSSSYFSSAQYDDLKDRWRRCVTDILLIYFPKV
jgi:all-trans-retinol 13,14-reductase